MTGRGRMSAWEPQLNAGEKFFLLPKDLENVATFSKSCAHLACSDKTSPPRKGVQLVQESRKVRAERAGADEYGGVGNFSPSQGSGGKRCERGLDLSAARITGVPRALLPPDLKQGVR